MKKKIYFLFFLLIGISTVSHAQTYCYAGGGMDEYISNVAVGNIINPSAATAYSDYTNLSTDMVIGEGYSIIITNGQPYLSDQCGIWIDWNHDFDFYDAGEFIATIGSPGYGPYTANIVPPASAELGQTRMRIRIMYSGSLLPCGFSTYGEVEDYTINVLPDCEANAEFSYYDLGLSVDFYASQNYDTTQYNLTWTLGDGTTILNQDELTHNYTQPGSYAVSLAVYDLTDSTCFDMYTDTIFLDTCLTNAEFFFDVNELNVEYYSYFNYDTSSYSMLWDLGDSTFVQNTDSFNYVYASAGIYPVSLTILDLYDSTCLSVVSYEVETWECNIVADFDIDIMGFNATFSTQYVLGDYIIEWDFGDGNTGAYFTTINHNYSNLGSYTVTLTVTDPQQPQCYDEISYDILINNCYANADFMFDIYGMEVLFDATTNWTTGYYFIWDFGNGVIDTANTTAQYTYPYEGTYTVGLTVASMTDSLCFDIDSLIITVDSCLAYADFNYLDTELSVDFFPDYPLDSINYSIYWDFGDGNYANNIIEPNHVYASPGQYDVSMVITNMYDSTCTDTFFVSVTVEECLANAEFTITDNGNYNYDFVLDNAPFPPGYYISWTLSDGTSYWNQTSINHTITPGGVFTATAVVNNWGIPNCTDTFTLSICDMDASFNYMLDGLEASFSTVYQYNSFGYYIEWDFGDGTNQAGGFNTTHLYPYDGTYVITAIVTSIPYPECADTTTLELWIAECYTQSEFTYMVDSNTVFFNTTFSPGDYQFHWDFGDGSTQIGLANTFHTYNDPGTYNACLTIVEIANPNCSDTACQYIDVLTTSLPDKIPKNDLFTIAPNPARDNLNLSVSEGILNRIEIYTPEGKCLLINVSSNSKEIIDISQLPAGNYFIRTTNQENVFVKKFVIIR